MSARVPGLAVLLITAAWLALGASPAHAAAPVCSDVSYTVETGQALALPIVGPCSDSDGPSPLQGQLASSPQHGSVGPGSNGGGIYRSVAGYVGEDSFTFRAWDGAELSNVATATITVTPGPGNRAPACASTNLDFTVGSNRTLRVPFAPNCTDEDNDALRMVVGSTTPANGALTLNSDGTINYRSDPGYVGADSFSFTVSDGALSSAEVLVELDVVAAPPNSSPVCPEQTVFVASGSSVDIFGNCVDPEGDPISYSLSSFPSGGSLQILSLSSVRYTPCTGPPNCPTATTSDSFTFTANDGSNPTEPIPVHINVGDPGDDTFESAPEATPEQPFTASVQTTAPGPVTFASRELSTPPPSGYFLLDQEFAISAPDGTATDPLRLVFTIDASQVPAGEIAVFRNEALVAPCTGPAGEASPDPCVAAVTTLGDGDVEITVLTSQASKWNIGVNLNPPPPPPPPMPQTKDDCKKNGWRSYGVFKNQGDCVSWVATQGKNPAAR